MRRMKEEHIVRRMQIWAYQGKDEEGDTINRVTWRKKLNSYTGDPRRRDKPVMDKKYMSWRTFCGMIQIWYGASRRGQRI